MSRKPVMRPQDWAEYAIKQTLIGVAMAATSLLFLPRLGNQAGIFLIGAVWAVSTLTTRRARAQASRSQPHPAGRRRPAPWHPDRLRQSHVPLSRLPQGGAGIRTDPPAPQWAYAALAQGSFAPVAPVLREPRLPMSGMHAAAGAELGA